MVAGGCNHRFQQCPSNAATPIGSRDVKAAHSTDVWVAGVGVAIESANAHHLTISHSHKQRLSRRIESVCAGNPLITQALYEPESLA